MRGFWIWLVVAVGWGIAWPVLADVDASGRIVDHQIATHANVSRTAVSGGTWVGWWDTRWRGGGAIVQLTQSGDRVTGAYPLYNGRIEAIIQGRQLVGHWIEPTRTGEFRFTLSPDGKTFIGRFDSGE